MSTNQWQRTLYPATESGTALRRFLEDPRIRGGAFDDEDRKVLSLVRSHEWEAVAYACRHELRSNMGIGNFDPQPKPREKRLFHPWRRIMRPKMVMRWNRQMRAGVTL